MFVIRGTTVSAEHVSGRAEPLNLKRFIYELDVPVIVGGVASYTPALHLMRTGAAGVLVGFGGGAAHTTRRTLGIHAPIASAIADVANEEVEKEKKAKATSGDWVWMIGLALIVSALSQWVGAKMGAGFAGMGLKMFDKGTCTTLFVTVLGLVCAMTPLGKLPAANELSSVLLYAVVALLATQAPLNALIEAPMWVVYGVFILVLHVVGMYILSKLFHWDLCMVSTASVANIGGPASAPIIAVAYNPNYAGIGVLMGIFGQAIGNFFGLGMGWLLNLMA